MHIYNCMLQFKQNLLQLKIQVHVPNLPTPNQGGVKFWKCGVAMRGKDSGYKTFWLSLNLTLTIMDVPDSGWSVLPASEYR